MTSKTAQPNYYLRGSMQVLAVLDRLGLSAHFSLGSLIKYLARIGAESRGDAETLQSSLEDALFYAERLTARWDTLTLPPGQADPGIYRALLGGGLEAIHEVFGPTAFAEELRELINLSYELACNGRLASDAGLIRIARSLRRDSNFVAAYLSDGDASISPSAVRRVRQILGHDEPVESESPYYRLGALAVSASDRAAELRGDAMRAIAAAVGVPAGMYEGSSSFSTQGAMFSRRHGGEHEVTQAEELGPNTTREGGRHLSSPLVGKIDPSDIPGSMYEGGRFYGAAIDSRGEHPSRVVVDERVSPRQATRHLFNISSRVSDLWWSHADELAEGMSFDEIDALQSRLATLITLFELEVGEHIDVQHRVAAILSGYAKNRPEHDSGVRELFEALGVLLKIGYLMLSEYQIAVELVASEAHGWKDADNPVYMIAEACALGAEPRVNIGGLMGRSAAIRPITRRGVRLERPPLSLSEGESPYSYASAYQVVDPLTREPIFGAEISVTPGLAPGAGAHSLHSLIYIVADQLISAAEAMDAYEEFSLDAKNLGYGLLELLEQDEEILFAATDVVGDAHYRITEPLEVAHGPAPHNWAPRLVHATNARFGFFLAPNPTTDAQRAEAEFEALITGDDSAPASIDEPRGAAVERGGGQPFDPKRREGEPEFDSHVVMHNRGEWEPFGDDRGPLPTSPVVKLGDLAALNSRSAAPVDRQSIVVEIAADLPDEGYDEEDAAEYAREEAEHQELVDEVVAQASDDGWE